MKIRRAITLFHAACILVQSMANEHDSSGDNHFDSENDHKNSNMKEMVSSSNGMMNGSSTSKGNIMTTSSSSNHEGKGYSKGVMVNGNMENNGKNKGKGMVSSSESEGKGYKKGVMMNSSESEGKGYKKGVMMNGYMKNSSESKGKGMSSTSSTGNNDYDHDHGYGYMKNSSKSKGKGMETSSTSESEGFKEGVMMNGYMKNSSKSKDKEMSSASNSDNHDYEYDHDYGDKKNSSKSKGKGMENSSSSKSEGKRYKKGVMMKSKQTMSGKKKSMTMGRSKSKKCRGTGKSKRGMKSRSSKSMARQGNEERGVGLMMQDLLLGDDVEIVFVDCPGETNRYVSTVVIDFDGEPQSLDDCEVAALEAAFESTYNALTFQRCDRFFRTIEETTITIVAERNHTDNHYYPQDHHEMRRLEEHIDIDAIASNVLGCRNCPLPPPLFDDSFGRVRKLSSVSPALHPQDFDVSFLDSESAEEERRILWHYEERDDVCVCSGDGVDGYTGEAPSTEEFRGAYNVALQELADEGILQHVTEALVLEEQKPDIDRPSPKSHRKLSTLRRL